MLYVMLYNCMLSDVWYQTNDIGHLITVNVRCLISDVWCHITVIRRLITINVRCLISDICYHITVIRHLMLYVMLYNCYQTFDNSYMKADVCYYTSDIRRLLTYNCYQMSYVICYSYVIRCLMSMMFVVWYQTSHVRCLISDLWYDIRYLITLIWQQLSEVSLMLYLMLYNCYQPSDVRRLIWWTSYDIRRLITVTSQQTSDVWYQTSAVM